MAGGGSGIVWKQASGGRLASSLDGAMAETPNDYFAARGFELIFTSHTSEEIAAKYEQGLGGLPKKVQRDTRRRLANGEIGPVFAGLRGPSGHVLDWYGYGADQESAAASALRRWKVEQGD